MPSASARITPSVVITGSSCQRTLTTRAAPRATSPAQPSRAEASVDRVRAGEPTRPPRRSRRLGVLAGVLVGVGRAAPGILCQGARGRDRVADLVGLGRNP